MCWGFNGNGNLAVILWDSIAKSYFFFLVLPFSPIQSKVVKCPCIWWSFPTLINNQKQKLIVIKCCFSNKTAPKQVWIFSILFCCEYIGIVHRVFIILISHQDTEIQQLLSEPSVDSLFSFTSDQFPPQFSLS